MTTIPCFYLCEVHRLLKFIDTKGAVGKLELEANA